MILKKVFEALEVCITYARDSIVYRCTRIMILKSVPCYTIQALAWYAYRKALLSS
jgi:hypothetical protein